MNSWSPDQRKATILLLSTKAENFRLLKDLFGSKYIIETEQTFDAESGFFDLCMMDTALIGKYGACLEKKKNERLDTYLPILGLVTGDPPDSIISRFDEIVRVPCSKSELAHRIENLLHARQLSIANKELLAQLRGEVVGLKQENRAIVSSEQRAVDASRELVLLADTLPQMVWTAEKDGAVNYANQRWYEYTGATYETTAGSGFASFIHPDDARKTFDAYAQALEKGEPLQVEHRFRRHDGEYRWFLIRAVPLTDERGEVVKWFGTCTDIEDQKQSEDLLRKKTTEAESANQTKSAFLANMSHEIRTPLGVIVGFSSLLKDGGLDEEERNGYVDTIIRNGQALTTIIDDILDLAKVEAGKIVVEKLEFSLYAVLTECVDMFKDRAKQKGIYLLLNIEEKTPADVCSDPTRLRQILINLIGNAIKFTDKGGVRVTAKMDGKDQIGANFSVTIKDTGIGLEPEQRDRLFRSFAQADESTTRKFGGTGLGLILSRKLANALDGDIWISDCAKGSGCTFVFAFKAQVTDSHLKAVAREHGPTNEKIFSGRSFLIVDDSSDNLFLGVRMLDKLGATVKTSSSGREAVDVCKQERFDCVLLDIQMPGIDGYETLRLFRENNYRGPVIALTAHAMLEERRRTKAAGFDGHVTKPVEKQALTDAIQAVIKTRESIA